MPVTGTPAAEALLSFKNDPAFGPVLVFGLGGLLTEWYGQMAPGATTAILRPGEVKQGLQAGVKKSPALKIFFEGNRAHAQAPLDAGCGGARCSKHLSKNLLFSFSPSNSLGNPTLEELEVNPLLLCADGRWVAADGKARFSSRRTASAARPLAKIAKLLAPKSAAVIGASASGTNPGRIILKNLKAVRGHRVREALGRARQGDVHRRRPVRPVRRRAAREGRPRGRLGSGARRDRGRRRARGGEGRVDHPDPGRLRRGGARRPRGRAAQGARRRARAARRRARPRRRQLPRDRVEAPVQHVLPAAVQAAVPRRAGRLPRRRVAERRVPRLAHEQPRRHRLPARVHLLRQPDGPHGGGLPRVLRGRPDRAPPRLLRRGVRARRRRAVRRRPRGA